MMVLSVGVILICRTWTLVHAALVYVLHSSERGLQTTSFLLCRDWTLAHSALACVLHSCGRDLQTASPLPHRLACVGTAGFCPAGSRRNIAATHDRLWNLPALEVLEALGTLEALEILRIFTRTRWMIRFLSRRSCETYGPVHGTGSAVFGSSPLILSLTDGLMRGMCGMVRTVSLAGESRSSGFHRITGLRGTADHSGLV